VKGEKTRVNQ